MIIGWWISHVDKGTKVVDPFLFVVIIHLLLALHAVSFSYKRRIIAETDVLLHKVVTILGDSWLVSSVDLQVDNRSNRTPYIDDGCSQVNRNMTRTVHGLYNS